jgi:3-oxoacyl-[acyl-carrier protein] reductase
METHTAKLAILTRTDSEFAPSIARTLIEHGFQLALVDGHSTPAQGLIETLPALSDRVFVYQCAVAEKPISETVKHIIKQQGIPQILITCPSIPTTAPTVELTEEQFRAELENRLIHAFLWSKIVGQHMLQAGQGVIVHITGLSGMGGWRGWAAQSAAFGGIHNLIHTLAAEWAQSGVRVNGLVPGITQVTAQHILATSPDHTQQEIIRRIPMERLATHEDICRALLYLISPSSSYVSGEILRVDGGWDIWGRLYAVAAKER